MGQSPEVVPRADLQEETSPRRTGWGEGESLVSGGGLARHSEQQVMVPDCGEGPWACPTNSNRGRMAVYVHVCGSGHTHAVFVETRGGGKIPWS